MRAKDAIQTLAAVGREAGQSTDEQQLVDALCGGLGALGAEGLSLGVRQGSGFRTLTCGFDRGRSAEYAVLPASSALPGPDAVRTGTELYLSDAASTIDLYPAVEELLGDSDFQAAACLPLRYPGGTYGYLAVHYTQHLHFTKTDKAMLELMAAATSGALARLTSGPRTEVDCPEFFPAPTPVPALAPTSGDCLESLSRREVQVLTAILAGLSNAELAQTMNLSINSIKKYIRGAYRKIGVETRTQAVLWGARHGLLREGPHADA